MTSCMAAPATTTTDPLTLIDFSSAAIQEARIQNDVVMGGRSNSAFRIDDAGHGVFSGHVSLENNGGFASVILPLAEPVDLTPYSSFQVRVKGDGKDYTLRVKDDENNRYWFQATFPTKVIETWETVAIPFASMHARFHGEPVDVPNFKGDRAVRFQLLIGNKVEQDFEIAVDEIFAL